MSASQPKKTESPSHRSSGKGSRSFAAPTIFQSDEFLSKRYDLIRRIGQGGMSAVFLAKDRQLDRQVAVKVMKPAEPKDAEDYATRFAAEARILAQLNHSNIVQVYDFAASESGHRIIMEYVDGLTLYQQVVKDGPMKEIEVAAVVCEVLDALEVIHEHDVIHRDIKPGNVMVDTRGQVKLMDFGIAMTGGFDTDASEGAVVGTLKFMAPEQSRAEGVTLRSDLFSVGAMMAFLLLGDLPSVLHPEDLPPMLRPVLIRAMAQQPQARYASAAEMREAIEEAIEAGPPAPPKPEKKRSPWLLLSLIGILLGVAIGAALFLPEILRSSNVVETSPPPSLPTDPGEMPEDEAPFIVIEDEEATLEELEGLDISAPSAEPDREEKPTPRNADSERERPTEKPKVESEDDKPAQEGAALAPNIDHTIVRKVANGDMARFEVNVDGTEIYRVEVKYRPVEGGSWRTSALRDRGNGRFTGSQRIGGELSQGVLYYVIVTEESGAGRSFPRGSKSMPFQIDVE